MYWHGDRKRPEASGRIAMPKKYWREPRSVIENSDRRGEITCSRKDGEEAVRKISST
jgi:hypothetical protein